MIFPHYVASARPITLIGLSGTGKSTIGEVLGICMGRPVLDTDRMVVQAARCPIDQIFREHGEARFREMEQEALRAALALPCIIATGGGIVLSEENRALLREHSYIVWLDAPNETLLARLLAQNETRPLLAGDPRARLDDLRSAREPLYAQLAHLRIETHQYTLDQACHEILRSFWQAHQ